MMLPASWFSFPYQERPMPVLFLGHGSPMNAIEENPFVAEFRRVGKSLPRPAAILCISAHWETRGTQVTAMQAPRTIHDFGGFPPALHAVQYPAPGSPELAQATQQLVDMTEILADHRWGLDHGAWSVLTHLFPKADVPVVQLSLDYTQPPAYHYALAQQLKELRHRGILVVGSGNMVHNLRQIAWNKLDQPFGFEWALEANDQFKYFIQQDQVDRLIGYSKEGAAIQRAIPSPEHFLPLLYTMGVRNESDTPQFFNDVPVGGSLTMTSVIWGG